jgi:hypothetical protein
MKTPLRVVAIVLVSALASCGRAAPKPPPPVAPAPRAAVTAKPPPPKPPSGRTLAVKLVVEKSKLRVRVVASGPVDEVKSWRLGEDEIGRVETRGADDKPLAFKNGTRAIDVTGDTRAGVVALSYDVLAKGDLGDDPRITRIEEARMRAVGERILAMPAAFEDKAVDATIEIDARTFDSPVTGSSFGAPHDKPVRVTQIRGSELRRSAFIAGGGGQAVFEAPEGHDEAIWLGYTAFDPRAVAAEVAGFRGVLHEYFHGTEPRPATLIFTVDGRQKGAFRAIRRWNGMLVAISGNEAYDAPLRLTVAHELVHAWIGERIWLGDATPGNEAQTYWFHEGVARWVAREQLARVGLLPPDDYAAEVNRLLAVVATGKEKTPMKELMAAGPSAVPVLIARGALFATALDMRIRDASKKKLSLDDALRALGKRAADTKGPLPADAFDAAIKDLGLDQKTLDQKNADFDDYVIEGKRTRLSDNALGDCFEPRDTSYDIPAVGFDLAASRASGKVVGVDPKGPAGVAGLKDGDTLVSVDGSFDKSDEPVRIEVARAGGAAVITYKPTAGSRHGQAFRRKEGLSETGCRKQMLRH